MFLLSCLTSVNNSIMHRKLQFMRMGMIRLISLVVTTIICIMLAIKGYGYYSILTKSILTSIINYILSLILCNTRFGLALDKVTFKQIFSFSGWLMASVLFRNLALLTQHFFLCLVEYKIICQLLNLLFAGLFIC